MFPGALQKTAPYGLLGGCRQRVVFARIRFQIVKTISGRIELDHEFVTRFTHRQRARSHAIFISKRVGAACNAFGDRGLIARMAFSHLSPGGAPVERRRNRQPRRAGDGIPPRAEPIYAASASVSGARSGTTTPDSLHPDSPRERVRVIPEWFEGGALPRQELHEAAEQLTADQAGLPVVSSEPVIVKHKVDATIDQITSELQESLK